MLLIVLAVYVLISKMGLVPDFPIGKLLVTVFCVYLITRGIVKRSFPQILIPAAVIACQYDEVLGITAITPWTLLAVAVLLSLGLGLIFPEHKTHGSVEVHYHTGNNGEIIIDDEHREESSGFLTGEQSIEGGDVVHYENNFNGTNQYVSSQNLLRAKIENNFGQCNVYFNNAKLMNNSATIISENNFGETNLYIPHTWRVQLEQKAAFGEVKMHGSGNNDMDAPFVLIQAFCNMGAINIFFE